jgi:hypothetical protein
VPLGWKLRVEVEQIKKGVAAAAIAPFICQCPCSTHNKTKNLSVVPVLGPVFDFFALLGAGGPGVDFCAELPTLVGHVEVGLNR